jgi:putative PIN family toxin of toxin-antitoxin system
MRIVLDTNVTVSGLLWGGPPRQILEAARAEQLELFTSPALHAELAEVLARPRFARRFVDLQTDPTELLLGFAALAAIVLPEQIEPVVVADPDDDMVIACALKAGADIIVSGDHHLLDLKMYQKIPILDSRFFVEEYLREAQ